MTHEEASRLLLQSGCVKSGQGYVIVVPIELFIERMREALNYRKTKYLSSSEREKLQEAVNASVRQALDEFK